MAISRLFVLEKAVLIAIVTCQPSSPAAITGRIISISYPEPVTKTIAPECFIANATSASSEPADGGGKKSALPRTISRAASGVSSPVPETNPQENERKQKWREPTRAAVNMSLRAEKEKTGGRRRLASDLYKIMMVSDI